MDQYPSSPGHNIYCYAELTASFVNFLHYCLPSSGLYGTGKDKNVLFAATLPIYPGLGQAQNNAGLHTQWFGCTEIAS